jgi:uncharacterized protein YjbI with pentapeptide repeats
MGFGKMSEVIKGSTISGSERTTFHGEEKIFVDCIFVDATLEGAQLDDAVFVDCRFERVDFYWALMFRATFTRCTFEEVDFRGANMQSACFVTSSFDRCDFSQDNLGGRTDLSGTHFIESVQRGCKYSDTKQV